MTVETILNAYQALKKLEDFSLPIEKSYALYLLNEEIDKKYKFFMQKDKGQYHGDDHAGFVNGHDLGHVAALQGLVIA